MAHFNNNPAKMPITLIVSTLLACFAAQGRSQTSNLIQDPGFEASAQLAPYWNSGGGPTSAGIDNDPAHAHSGSNNGYLYDDWGAGRFIELTQTVSVAANTTYTLSGWVDASNTTSGVFGVRTSVGAAIRTAAFANTDPGPTTHAGSDYVQYTVTFNSGNDTSVVVFVGYVTPGSSSFINLDGVSLVGGQSSTPAPIPTPTPTPTPTPAPPAASASGTAVNCSSFSTSGACGIAFNGGSNNQPFFSAEAGGSVTGGAIDFVPAGATHNGAAIWYQTRLNVQAFTTTFTFVPNGYNFAFVIQNVTNQGNPFTDGFGAGGEGGFSQFAGGSNIAPNNIWALSFDSGGFNTQTQSSYTNGGVQIYQTLQVPALPVGAEAGYLPWYPTDKVSVSSPFSFTTGTQYVPTGHTYGATVTYDGNNVALNMWDVTAGGSCPGSSCFTHTWQGVYIPAIVAGTTAVVGFTSGIGLTTTDPLYIRSFSYSVDAPSGLTSMTASNANAVMNNGTASAASPVYSVAPGTYAGATSVAISTSTAGAYICYTLSSSTPALTPQPNNNGGCSAGTLYSGPISISSSATLYAMAGTSNAAHPSALGPPSALVAGTYTIDGTASASIPTFPPGK
jgi:hypothetical protein